MTRSPEHAEPTALVDSVLSVAAESTAWATQLRMVQAQLLAKIAAVVGDGVVTSLKITGPVGPSWRKGPRPHISGRDRGHIRLKPGGMSAESHPNEFGGSSSVPTRPGSKSAAHGATRCAETPTENRCCRVLAVDSRMTCARPHEPLASKP